MKTAMFDTHSYEREPFDKANATLGHDIRFLELRLTGETAPLARGSDAVCAFVNDRLDAQALEALSAAEVRLVALRSAGVNHVDLATAARLGRPVVRVPEYSPCAVAEHAVALVLTMNRKLHRAYARVRDWNFSLEGLVGVDLFGKTLGILGTGRIGCVAAPIFHGFGCRILAFDMCPDAALGSELGAQYVDLVRLYRESDILSLHVPLIYSGRVSGHFDQRLLLVLVLVLSCDSVEP